MKLELQLPEIEHFIKSHYKHSVKIKYIGYNEISVSYLFIVDVKITVKEVHRYSVLLNYTLNWASKLLLKGAGSMIRKKLGENILLWNTSKKEICINFSHIDVLKELLKIVYISTFEIRNNEVFLELVN
ncbi:hypothetical protein EZS27_014922 [termite gut metagenome]|uniref:Uncharacterized protein n=1 Tax=termite gut metagenome TaxID=433724 RepID=A0A5J4RVI4_9ZZZZ